MTVEKAGGYISELEFNTGEKVQINRNDIVVFVGPNNAGKSQSLKDIYTLTGKKLPSVVISNVKITKSNLPFKSLLDSVSVGKKQGSYTTYSVMGHNINCSRTSFHRLEQNTRITISPLSSMKLIPDRAEETLRR